MSVGQLYSLLWYSGMTADQGADFESKLIKELCEVAGIKKCRTTPPIIREEIQ